MVILAQFIYLDRSSVKTAQIGILLKVICLKIVFSWQAHVTLFTYRKVYGRRYPVACFIIKLKLLQIKKLVDVLLTIEFRVFVD